MSENQAVEIFLYLVRCGLRTRSVVSGVSVFDNLDSADRDRLWLDVYSLAASQGLLAVAWDGLRRLIESDVISADYRPSRNLCLRWAFNVEQIEQRYDQQRHVIKSLSAFYARHGIPMMLLKGYGLSLYYPIPRHRSCGDIDIWLFGRQHEADDLISRKYGIKVDNAVHHHTIFRVDGVTVENHYDFFNIHSHRSNREIDGTLKRLVNENDGEIISLGDVTFRVPNANFNALFLLRHAAGHFAAIGISMRHVTDWAMFVDKNSDRIDWIALINMAKKQNMDKFLCCMNAFAVDLIGISPDKMPLLSCDNMLEKRVLYEIISPEFSRKTPKSAGLVRFLQFKIERWWANRWKHRMVYREGLIQTFVIQLYSHLLKPRSLKS